MSEILTSLAEAAEMRTVLMKAVDDLERRGFTRSQIGSCIAGIGPALVAVHSGKAEAHRVLNGVRDALLADEPNS